MARVAARALNVAVAVITLLEGEKPPRVWSVGCAMDPIQAGGDTLTSKLLLPAVESGPPVPLTLVVSIRQADVSPHHLSAPLRASGPASAGVLCVATRERRQWTGEDHAILGDIACMAANELALGRERAEREAIAARLERTERLKSQFASALRHEFGQPLTVIQGFSELLSEEGLSPEEIREFAAEIHKEAAHLAEIVAQIRDIDQKVEEFTASRGDR
jgi:signal transduction histidine kinase